MKTGGIDSRCLLLEILVIKSIYCSRVIIFDFTLSDYCVEPSFSYSSKTIPVEQKEKNK